MLKTAQLTEQGGYNFAYGNLFYVFSSFTALLIFSIIYTLYRQLKQLTGVHRTRITYLLIGFMLAALYGLSSDLLLPIINIRRFADTGPIGTLLFCAFTSYSIVAHQLFDIRFIIKKTVVYSGLLIAVLLTYSTVVLVSASLFGEANGLNAHAFFTNFIAATLICIGLRPLEEWLQEKTDRFLFRREYEEQTVLKELSESLNTVVGLDEALEAVMQMLVRTLKVSHAITYVFQPAENGGMAIKRIKQIGYGPNKNLLLQDRDFVINYFTSHPAITLTQGIREEAAQATRTLKRRPVSEHLKKNEISSKVIREHARQVTMLKRLAELGAEIVIPLQIGQQPLGLILLSAKQSDEQFSSDDVQLLEVVGAQAISSIQKAKLYEGDQIKSEFVSIASHELLTPISAIEGYLSMIVDEKLGKVDEQAMGYLEKVYASSKRLSALIKDLLSVSRIESGRLVINYQAVDIHKLITDATDQLRLLAETKKIILRYDAPSHPLPAVRADPDRCNQVIINLISNAIKYTNEGSVTVRARLTHGSVIVEVRDTGIGMTPEQLSHLFERFYRVDSNETAGISGTGLGLYITRSILERMGSHIHVTSTHGKGSNFSFSLPLFLAEVSPVVEYVSSQVAPTTASPVPYEQQAVR